MFRSLSNIVSRLVNTPLMMFHRKVRTTQVPTQDSVLRPFKICYLHDNPGARRYAKIVGRGPRSNKGKTCGRGIKGHKARTGGGVPPKFEGGQSPITRRLPKFGSTKRNKQRLDYVNIGQIAYLMKRGIIQPNETVTIKTLVDKGLASKVKYGMKILGKGIDMLTAPINLEVTDASANVIAKIKELGGSVKCIYRTKKTLAAHLKPEHYPLPMEEPMPIVRKVEQLDRIAARGAQVQYVKPKWKQDMLPVEPPKFEYPVKRFANMGQNKIRTRKPKLYKEVSYNLP